MNVIKDETREYVAADSQNILNSWKTIQTVY